MLMLQGGIKTYIVKNAVSEILFKKNYIFVRHSPLWELEGKKAKTVTRDKNKKWGKSLLAIPQQRGAAMTKATATRTAINQ